MTFAFGHLVFAWLLGKIFENLRKKKLSRIQWFLLLFGSILPDVDYLLEWTSRLEVHRTLTHSLLMVIIAFFIVGLVCLFIKKKLDWKTLGLFFSFGIATHLILDMVMGYPGVPLLWPLSYRFWLFGFASTFIPSQITLADLAFKINFAIFDMGLGVFWIGYLFYKKKLREF